MHSACFCYRSNNVWFWKGQGLVSCRNEMSKMQKKKKKRSDGLPLSKKGYWHLKSSMGGIYIYICSAPPKQTTKKKKKQLKKKQNHGDCRISNGFGFFVFFGFVFFWFFSKGPSPKSLQVFFVGSMIFFYSLPGILPKEYQNIVVFLFV